MTEEHKDEEAFQAELADLGLIIIDQKEVEGDFGLAIECDLDTEVDYTHLVESGLTLKKLTKRKDFFYIRLKEYNKEKKRLTILVATPLSPELYMYYSSAQIPQPIATTFPDLCWYHAEGTTDFTLDELETKLREDGKIGDLTWYLPSRVIDNFIEIMHTLNLSLLQGLMQEVICYGPFILEDKLKQ